jgi:hypothetical protein
MLNALKKECPCCHQTVPLQKLLAPGKNLRFSCPLCLKSLQLDPQQYYLYELLAFCSIIFVGGIFFSHVAHIISITLLLLLYRSVLLAAPFFCQLVPDTAEHSFMTHIVQLKSFFKTFFIRQCPSCQYHLTWAKRCKMKNLLTIKCPSCKTLLRVHPRDQIINGFLLAWLIHSMMTIIIGQSVFVLEILLYISIINTQAWRAFEALFSLVVWPKNASGKRFL